MGWRIKITFNTKEVRKLAIASLKRKMEYFGNVLLEEIDKNTPEDTKTLLGNNKKSELIEVGKKIYLRLYNDTEYAKYVEYGVGKIFKYNKPKGNVFYEGKGAGMFAKAFHIYENKFNKITKNI